MKRPNVPIFEPWYLTWLGVRVGSNRLLVKTAIACSGVDTNVEYISKPHTTSLEKKSYIL